MRTPTKVKRNLVLKYCVVSQDLMSLGLVKIVVYLRPWGYFLVVHYESGAIKCYPCDNYGHLLTPRSDEIDNPLTNNILE